MEQSNKIAKAAKAAVLTDLCNSIEKRTENLMTQQATLNVGTSLVRLLVLTVSAQISHAMTYIMSYAGRQERQIYLQKQQPGQIMGKYPYLKAQ